MNTFDLGSFLIKPVQRILKYPLLLQELLKLADIPGPGEDRGEYDDLIEAVKLLQEAANDINEDKRRKDLGEVFILNELLKHTALVSVVYLVACRRQYNFSVIYDSQNFSCRKVFVYRTDFFS